MLDGKDGCLDARMDAQFAQDSLDVQFHRAVGDAEVAGDQLVALPLSQQ